MAAYLKIEGATKIPGESTQAKHKDWIVVDAWNWGVGRSVMYDGGRLEAGTTEVQNLTISKAYDLASPLLAKECAAGTKGMKVTLNITQDAGDHKEYLTVILEEAILTSYQVSGGNDKPSDSFSFSYQKVKFEYKQMDEKGNAKGNAAGGYDIKERKAI